MDNIKILVIDDEPALTRSVQSYLEDYDYIVDTANSGREGMDLYSKIRHDVVITDLMMPGITGHDVLTYVKEISPTTPTIVASGAGRVSDAVTAIKNGAWDYLTKPIHDLDVLKLTIERVLEKARLINENKQYQEHLEQLVESRTVELNQTVNDLTESRENLKITLDSIGDMVIVTDKNDIIVRINPATRKSINLSEDEIINHPLSEIITFSSLNDTSRNEIQQLQEQEALVLNSQRSITVVGTISPLHGVDTAKSMGNVIVLSDITEERTHEKLLQQAQKMESIGRLASGISHDFKNVLSGIMGMSELILLEIDNPELKTLVQAVLTASESSSNLISKMLSFTRNENETLLPIDINEYIEDTELILHHTLGSQITIKTELSLEHSIINGNSSEIQNSLINLSINARDAMGGKGTLLLKTEVKTLSANEARQCNPPLETEKYLVLSVTDTGTGISKKNIGLIFEPFFTTKEDGKGTGLGLASVYGSQKNHNGAISVESTPGKGTTFKLYFQLAEEQHSEKSDEKQLAGLTILILENETTIQFLFRSILERAGATMISAYSGRDGIDLYQKQYDTIDLVIVDMYLSDIDGLTCIQELQKQNGDLRAVLCSGAQFPENGFKNSAVVNTLAKPFTVKDVISTVKESLKE